MSVPCSCGGSNENCARCFGLGSIDESSTNQTTAFKKRNSNVPHFIAEYPRLNPNPLEPPPNSGAKHRAHGFVLGEGVLPPPADIARKNVSSATCSNKNMRGPRSTVRPGFRSRCSMCSATFTFEVDLREHLRGGCPARPTRRKRIQALPIIYVPPREVLRQQKKGKKKKNTDKARFRRQPLSVIPAPDFMHCPSCSCVLKQRNLAKHYRCCPALKPAAKHRPLAKPLQSEGTGGSHPPELGDLKNRVRFDQAKGWDRLDATKPYAHAYRENGRYGSHPSHDGFDDDSGPE